MCSYVDDKQEKLSMINVKQLLLFLYCMYIIAKFTDNKEFL